MAVTVEYYLKGLQGCLGELSPHDIGEIVNAIFDAYENGKQVFVFGNGGSASTASHFARDLRIGTAVDGKPRLQATSLTDNVAMLTALANDIDYESIFKEQLVGLLRKGDVVIGISASGNSPNVLRAVEFARERGAVAIGLIGFGGGRLKKIVHRSITLSSMDYGQVEDTHLVLAHIISYLIRERIAND